MIWILIYRINDAFAIHCPLGAMAMADAPYRSGAGQELDLTGELPTGTEVRWKLYSNRKLTSTRIIVKHRGLLIMYIMIIDY